MRKVRYEIGFSAIAFAVLVFILRSALINGDTTFSHDNYYWNYPTFHFLADNLLNGSLPLWNPYTHAGEPFYPTLLQMRFLEPTTLLTLFVGSLFTKNTTLLFNWQRIIASVFMVSGMYLVLRRFTRHLMVRLTVIPILFFSSVMLNSLRSDGIINHFLWTPFITYFLLKIFVDADTRLKNWAGLSLSVGMNFQSYFFVYPSLFTLLFLLGLFLMDREKMVSLFKRHVSIKGCCLFFIPVFCMMVPNINHYLNRDHYEYPVRHLPANYEREHPHGGPPSVEIHKKSIASSMLLPYEAVIYAGTFDTVWNFIQLWRPSGNAWVNPKDKIFNAWGNPSEGYLYIGILSWALALVGLFFGKDKTKVIWGCLLTGFLLFALGPSCIVYRFLFFLIPPLRIVRHGAHAALYLEFALLYFFVLGCNLLYEKRKLFVVPADVKSISFVIVGSFLFALFMERFAVGAVKTATFYAVVFGCYLLALRKIMRGSFKEYCFLFLFIGSLGIVFYCDPMPVDFGFEAGMAIAVPLLLYRLIKRDWVCGLLLFCSVGTDTLFHIHRMEFLFDDLANPAFLIGTPENVTKPAFPEFRRVSPEYQYTSQMILKQGMRYPELLRRKSYLLSPVKYVTFLPPDLSEARISQRWDTLYQRKDFYELVHLNVSDALLGKVFAIGAPVFQKKNNMQVIENVSDYFTAASEKEMMKVTENTLFIEPKDYTISSIYGASGGSFSYEIDSYKHNKIQLTLRNEAPGYLYWADGYDPDWRAEVDGKPVSLFKVNMNFKAIEMPAGVHSAVFTYMPWKFLLALAFFYLGMCTALFGLFWKRLILVFRFTWPTSV